MLFTNFISENSVNFDGLSRNEFLVKQIGPPKWPFAIDAALRAQGEAIFARPKEQGGCQTCHGITEGKTLHRIDEAVVRTEVLQAGFVLDAEGSFLRNTADSRTESSNEPKVPTDKFALRFVKP